MSKSIPSSVTAEEAVARMVNMDYIPEGFTLEEMLAAFTEEAEVEYENAKTDRLTETQIKSLKVRLEACEARQLLAQRLLQDLQNETSNAMESMIVLSSYSSSKTRYTLDSVADWASHKYGIGLPEWSSDFSQPATTSAVPIDAKWEDIRIKIRKGNIIAYSYKENKWEKKTFGEIGLLNKRTQGPNNQGAILIGLSHSKNYPTNEPRQGKHAKAISLLGKSLRTLIGIKSDPFIAYNKTDGWKPRFKLTDARSDADKRAEKAALHEEYDDGVNYDDEDDAAGKFLRDNI